MLKELQEGLQIVYGDTVGDVHQLLPACSCRRYLKCRCCYCTGCLVLGLMEEGEDSKILPSREAWGGFCQSLPDPRLRHRYETRHVRLSRKTWEAIWNLAKVLAHIHSTHAFQHIFKNWTKNTEQLNRKDVLHGVTAFDLSSSCSTACICVCMYVHVSQAPPAMLHSHSHWLRESLKAKRDKISRLAVKRHRWESSCVTCWFNLPLSTADAQPCPPPPCDMFCSPCCCWEMGLVAWVLCCSRAYWESPHMQ